MIALSDPGNLVLVLFLAITLGLPMTFITMGFFQAVRLIPWRPAQCLVPLVAGIVLVIVSSSVDPSNPEESGLFLFLVGILTHPLLILPPIILMKKYLLHIPVLYAVFFAAFISLCSLIAWGALQGDLRMVEPVNVLWQITGTVITDLIIASGASGLILGLDRVLIHSGRRKTRPEP